MKRIIASVATIAALVGFVSCQKTDLVPSQNTEGSTFTLSADIQQTKTTINGLEVNWEEGDVLYLVTTDGPWGKPYNDDKGGATIAEYTYAGSEFTSEATIAAGSYTFNALYGSASQKSYHRGASTTYNLQSTQNQDCTNPTAHLKINDALAGSFTASVPRTTPASVSMSHIFAIMRVDVKNATGADVELKSFEMSAAGANLAGIFTVNFANSPIDITEKTSLSSSITVNLTNGTVAAGASLPVYFVMAPLAKYSGDVTFTVTDADDKVYTKTVALSNVTFSAGSLNTTPYKISTGVAPTSYIWDLSVDSTKEADADHLAWTNAVADMVYNKDKSTTNANNYYPGTSGKTYKSTRFYTKSILSITPKAGNVLTYYVFEATSDTYATGFAKSTWTNATANVDGTTVTIVANDPSSAVSAVIGASCGFTKVECHTDPAPTIPPVINASPMSFSIKAAGEVCTIKYSIDFPVDGKSISATSNQDWVNSFDYSTAGEISFVVEENTGDTRSATIILSYEGAESVNITVAQNGASSANSKKVEFIAGTDTSTGTSLSKEDVTITITGGTLSRNDNYRVYAGKSMTISVPNGNIITRIETEEVSGNANLTADGFARNELNGGTWIGASESVEFSCTEQSRITKITVTYE